MHFKGKKPIYNYKDTFSLDSTLSPIICAGLIKFKEVITKEENSSHIGVPSAVLLTLYPELGYEHSNEQLEEGNLLWLSYLDSMIYSFGDNEPDINDYKFEFVSGEHDGEVQENGCIRYDKVPSDKSEYDRYKADDHLHIEKVQLGLDLFAKYYNSLWW